MGQSAAWQGEPFKDRLMRQTIGSWKKQHHLVVLALIALFLVPACKERERSEVPFELYHDFRGKALPKELAWYNVVKDDVVFEEPRGLRIRIPSSWNHPPGGVGFKTASKLTGDFEATITFELLEQEIPSHGSIGVGMCLAVDKAGFPQFTEAASLLRVVHADGNQVVSWHWRHDGQLESDSMPCSYRLCRLRLKRTGATLSCLWAPGTEGGDFQEIKQIPYGNEDIDCVRVTAVTGRSPANVELRVLDMRIRGNVGSGSSAPRSRIALLLAVAFTVFMLFASVLWILARRRVKTKAFESATTSDVEQKE
jgi:hypothetical protein